MSVELSFPASSSGDANVFARELRTELVACGVPVDAIKLARVNPENMDLGTILQVGFTAISAVPATYEIARAIINFSKRTQSVVKIRSAEAQVDISTNTADAAHLGDVLQKLAEYYRDRAC